MLREWRVGGTWPRLRRGRRERQGGYASFVSGEVGVDGVRVSMMAGGAPLRRDCRQVEGALLTDDGSEAMRPRHRCPRVARFALWMGVATAQPRGITRGIRTSGHAGRAKELKSSPLPEEGRSGRMKVADDTQLHPGGGGHHRSPRYSQALDVSGGVASPTSYPTDHLGRQASGSLSDAHERYLGPPGDSRTDGLRSSQRDTRSRQPLEQWRAHEFASSDRRRTCPDGLGRNGPMPSPGNRSRHVGVRRVWRRWSSGASGHGTGETMRQNVGPLLGYAENVETLGMTRPQARSEPMKPFALDLQRHWRRS